MRTKSRFKDPRDQSQMENAGIPGSSHCIHPCLSFSAIPSCFYKKNPKSFPLCLETPLQERALNNHLNSLKGRNKLKGAIFLVSLK